MTLNNKLKAILAEAEKATPNLVGRYTSKLMIEHKPTIDFIRTAQFNVSAMTKALLIAVQTLQKHAEINTYVERGYSPLIASEKALAEMEKCFNEEK